MTTAILFIIMMLVLIGPHEFGHFIVAKKFNIKVNEFSIGFGPALYKKQKGETLYSIRAIPMGGFCAMEGEDGTSDNPRAFNNQKPLVRAAVLIAGVTMNVVIALVVTVIAISISGVPVNKLDSVVKDSPAAAAGIERGDVIVSVDDTRTSSWTDVITAISASDGKEMKLVIKRDGDEHDVTLVPEYDKAQDRYTIGIVAQISRNPVACVPYGIKYTWTMNKAMIKGVAYLFSGKASSKDVAGPVGLVKIVDQTKEYGFTSYLFLLALVSLNLALINLIPIPGLDGGKLLFVLLKWITRGRIGDDQELNATVIGAILLIGFFVFLTYNDIRNLF